MKYLFTLLTLFIALTSYGAASGLNGEVLVNVGTSGTNALPSSRTTNTTVLVQSNAGDGTNAFRVNAAMPHTSGNLVEVQNNGVNKLTADYRGKLFSVNSDFTVTLGNGAIELHDENFPDGYVFIDGGNGDLGGFGFGVFGHTLGVNVFQAAPSGAGSPPYLFGTDSTISSGNLVEVKNNTTNKFVVDFAGSIQVSSNPPANAGATGVAGTITWDSGFIYVCVSANTWKRVAIATWP